MDLGNGCESLITHCHEIAPTLNAHFGEKQGLEDQHINGGAACLSPDIARCLVTKTRIDAETETLIPTGGYFDDAQSYGIPGNWIGRKPENGGNAVEPMRDVAPCLTGTDRHGVAYDFCAGFKARQGSKAGGIGYDENVSPTLSAADSGSNRTPTILSREVVGFHSNAQADQLPGAGRDTSISDSLTCSQSPAVAFARNAMQVRRLTPTECERLQGFPDGYTDIRLKGKDTPDGPRYKALGNSMAVNVMHWIGQRIEKHAQST